jgi:hypothetical protein|tara:strand:- start:9305 stop:10300 length:996 start_codon:yes stop_codon:yes gene_type:complete
MVQQTLLDEDRRGQNLSTSKIREVLPEHYIAEYPKLVSFLEKYYDYMDSDANHGFDNDIQNLYKLRDVRATELTYLNQIFGEIGQGLVTADYFKDPRLIAGMLADNYRIKGSLSSSETFFRTFYGEQPEIVYPKANLFIVGESKIGSESLRYIQNGALYQVLSVLVRSSVPIAKWRDLYKSFVHPSGFFLGGEVILESLGNLNLGTQPLAILDSDAGQVTLQLTGTPLSMTAFTSITGIFDDTSDSGLNKERVDLNATVKVYSELTVAQFDAMYNDIEDAIDANSPRFDEDSDGTIKAVKFSNTFETMDQSYFDGKHGSVFADSAGGILTR